MANTRERLAGGAGRREGERHASRAAAFASAVVIALAASGSGVAAAELASGAPTQPGRYDATLCVRHADEAPSCGAAELELQSGGRVRVRVSDIVYRVRVGPVASEVFVLQGSMQIDEFVSGAAWSGGLLRFEDGEKRLRYEVQVTSARRASR
jgi:hypothetical protein